MRLTPKLLDLVNRVFDKDPLAFLALRVRYDGGMTWAVADGSLTITVTGGVGSSVTYDLSQYSLRSLADEIAARSGFEVAFLDGERAKLSALVLLDGSGDQAMSNGDRLLGYTSILWAFFESFSAQLQTLRDQVAQMLLQMSTTTAEGVWLDELGSYYGVKRELGEVDTLYGRRIITETLRPLSNNVAIERAIEDFTAQPCTVLDVTIYRGVEPLYDGSIVHDGTHNYDVVGVPEYGLFDISVAYDLIEGGDISSFLDDLRVIVERLRAAGTHLRALALSAGGSPISETVAEPSESDGSPVVLTVADISEALDAPAELASAWVAAFADITEALAAPTESTADVLATTLAAVTDPLDAPTEVTTLWSASVDGMTDALDAPTESSGMPLAETLGGMSDTLDAPTEATAGAILGGISDGAGGFLVDENGNQIQAPVADLFV